MSSLNEFRIWAQCHPDWSVSAILFVFYVADRIDAEVTYWKRWLADRKR